MHGCRIARYSAKVTASMASLNFPSWQRQNNTLINTQQFNLQGHCHHLYAGQFQTFQYPAHERNLHEGIQYFLTQRIKKSLQLHSFIDSILFRFSSFLQILHKIHKAATSSNLAYTTPKNGVA